MEKRQEVFSVIHDERVYQDRKWGSIELHPHEVGSWLTIMRSLLNDAEKAYSSERGDIGALDEIRKVVAVGVACMEQHGPVPRKPIDFAAQSKHFTVHKAERVKENLRGHCFNCGGKGVVSKYFDAGDHFGAGSAPGSGWEDVPCDKCNPGK